MNKIALSGAAGAIGQSIAKAVSAQGAPYRVVGRSRDALAAAFGADSLAEIVTWNPDDSASVQAAAAGVDAIVYLVGVYYWQFELHPRLMKQTLDGAIAAGVKRIVLIGTVEGTRILRSQFEEPRELRGEPRVGPIDQPAAAAVPALTWRPSRHPPRCSARKNVSSQVLARSSWRTRYVSPSAPLSLKYL